MKNIIKNIFINVFGTQENIMLKINISCFIISFIFSVFAFAYQSTFGAECYFTFISAIFFSIWIVLTKGVDSLQALGLEALRVLLFLFAFAYSFSYSLEYVVNNKSVSLVLLLLSVLGIVFCVIYLVCKMIDILNFVKKIFVEIKIKLFNTDKPASNKVKALIENSTAFLVAIGGFAIAIKTIVETIYQVMGYLL